MWPALSHQAKISEAEGISVALLDPHAQLQQRLIVAEVQRPHLATHNRQANPSTPDIQSYLRPRLLLPVRDGSLPEHAHFARPLTYLQRLEARWLPRPTDER
jgi:hypothetical protein